MPELNERWSLKFLGLAMLIIAGCGGSSGPERVSVSGEVSFDGTPIESGSIAFIPDGSTVGPSAGGEIKQGRYSVARESGPVLGAHRVEVTAHRAGKQIDVAGAGGASAGPSGGGTVHESEMYIPEQFNKKSKLTVNITSGSNVHNFTLKSAQ